MLFFFFRGLAAKGPGAADLLEKMLIALGVDPRSLAIGSSGSACGPTVVHRLCSQKGRCEHALADGTAAERFHEFCPNAFTLDPLFKQKQQQNRH